MLTVTEFAKTITRKGSKKAVSRQYIISLLKAGRIPGAYRIGSDHGKQRGIWLIPENAQILDLPSKNSV